MATTNRSLLFCLMIGVVPAAFVAGPVRGQEEQGFWDAERRRQAAFAAVQMIMQPSPYAMAWVRIGAKEKANNVWHEFPGYDPALGAPQLNPARLALIKDRTDGPDFRGRDPQSRSKVDQAAYDLFSTALYFSSIAGVEAFEKSAADNSTVTFGHLYKEANRRDDKRELVNRYRGKVIAIQGQLLRLRKYPAPIPLLDKGILFVYEGWIKGPTPGAHPFCVVVPNQPEDKNGLLEPAEEMNRPVRFYGYFFKLLPYRAAINAREPLKTQDLDTPMLIGPALILTGPPAVTPGDDNPASYSSLLMILAGFGGFAAVILLALTWWFRKDDRRFRDRLHQFRSDQVLDLPSDKPSPHSLIKNAEDGIMTDPGPELTSHDQDGPKAP